MEHKLLCGYAEAVVTPPMGVHIFGYYNRRISDGIITDLHIRAAAFSDGEKKAVFFSCEAIGINANAGAILRPMIAERCGIPVEAVYISCCHSHTAFRIIKPSSENNTYDVYLHRLFQQFCDVAQFAFEDLKPASLKTAMGSAEGVGFKRRYYMKDGSTKTNPGMGNPDVAAPVGEQDDSVRLIRVVREGAKELLLVCFGTHADVIGGTKYCADWPGYLVDDLKGAFDGEVEVLFFNGAEGDSAHNNHLWPKGYLPKKGVERAQRMARKVAGEVLRIYDDAKDIPSDTIDYETVSVQVGKNPYDPEMVPVAQKMREIYSRTHDNKDPDLAPYLEKLNLPEALRIVANLNRPEFFDLKLTLVRIGDAAFVGFPGEPFQDIGFAVKEKSPFDVTVVTACTNGGEGYFPTREAFETPGYERSASPFAWDVAEKLEEGALKGLSDLYGQKSE